MIFKLKVSAMTGAAAAIFALAPVGSHADDAGSLAQTRVAYANLDPTSDADVAHLYHRLLQAADAVCQGDSRQLVVHSAYQNCVNKAMEAAVSDVDMLKLSTMYRQKTGV
jgi:UrcA family protein